MRPTKLGRLSDYLSRWLLLVYPPRFRRTMGDDLQATFGVRIAAARRRGGAAVAGVVLAKCSLLMLRDGLLERAREMRIASRAGPPAPWFSGIAQDLGWAWRSLRRAPAFSVLIVAVLAVSLGANTAIFSVVDSVLFRPLPLRSADRLTVVCETNEVVEGFCTNSFVNVRDWNDRSRSFAALGAARQWPFVLSQGDANESVNAVMASPEVFEVFQFTPSLGRLFGRADEGTNVVVLTAGLWQTRFGSDPAIVGRSISLGGDPYEVIGVLPADAEIPVLGTSQVWVPIPFDYADPDNREWRGFRAFGRLNEGASLRTATGELESIVFDLSQLYPETNADWGVRTESLLDYVVGDTRGTLVVFLGAIALVLAIACTNVAHLILVRSARRTREIAVRTAIGAGPARVRRMLLLEGILLAAIGGALGLFIGWAGVDAFVALAPQGIPRLDEVTLDARAVVFLSAVSLLTAVIVALAPGRLASSLDVTQALKGAGPGGGGSSTGRRGWVISAQVGLTSTLLIGAALLLRSFLAFTAWSPGFQPDNLTVFWTLASRARYESGHDVMLAFREATDRLEALPGVSSVSTVSGGPLFGGRETGRVARSDAADQEVVVRWFDAGPGYFETMRQPLLRGRTFSRLDDQGSTPVVVVNAALAERLWPDDDPIGRQLEILESGSSMEVVGVVGNITPFTPGTPVEYAIYWPNLQRPRMASYFVVRSAGRGEIQATLIEDVMKEVDPEFGVSHLTSMHDLVSGRLVQPRFSMVLIGSFAVCAMLLATAGVFGVISYSVARRTREIGVRKSLGATRGGVVRLILREGFSPAAIGILVGIAASLALGGLLAGVVYGVSPRDPLTLAATAFVMAAAAVAACLVPALTAARVEPMVALRAE